MQTAIATSPDSAPSPAEPPRDPATAPTPGVWRRLAAFTYEGVLLFGLVVIVALFYGVLTDQRHALAGQFGLQAVLFATIGVYFIWFWTHGGQTLAMTTWHVRLVRADGRPVGAARALARYLLAWLWFAPSLLAVHVSGLTHGGLISAALLANVAAYAALALLHPDRQFWHDAVCRTRLVTWRPPPRRKAAARAA